MKGKYMLAGLALVALLAAGCGGGKAAETTTPAPAAAAPATTAPATTAPATTAPAATAPTSTAPASTAPATATKYAVVAEGAEASYTVGETFLGVNRDATAIGKTAGITGEIVLNGGVIQPSNVQVDLSTLQSDESRRDNRVRQTLDTANHKYATFKITGAEGNPVLKEGQEVAVKLQGNMTIKGTEKPLAFDAKVKLSGDTLSLTATTTFNMTTFGVQPPNMAGFVSVKDEVQLNVAFVGKR
jgi:polyisoprenoid-binding protein YceI